MIGSERKAEKLRNCDTHRESKRNSEEEQVKERRKKKNETDWPMHLWKKKTEHQKCWQDCRKSDVDINICMWFELQTVWRMNQSKLSIHLYLLYYMPCCTDFSIALAVVVVDIFVCFLSRSNCNAHFIVQSHSYFIHHHLQFMRTVYCVYCNLHLIVELQRCVFCCIDQ